MNTRSFNKIASIATLLLFLATPELASAQGFLGNGGANQGALGGMSPLVLMMMMQGGRGGSGAGGSGGLAQAGQFLALAGLLSGNMGLAMAGLLTSMLGGLASSAGGGAGSTPQTGQVDERYVAPGAGGPASVAANSPYYTTPAPQPTASTSPAPSCSQSIFIVNDTTASPATTKPYPSTLTLPQSDCALVINTDTANHSLNGNSVAMKTSQIFRFASKKVYKMCVDASTTACTSVTVQ